MDIKACAFNTSAETLFLDHISPLASLLNIPLMITAEKNVELTGKYYPEVNVRYWPDLEFRLGEIASEFNTLFECNFWNPQLKEIFRLYTKKPIRLIFCPHGQSDKGYKAPSLSPYALQDTVLLYGSLMKEMLQELHIWPLISSFAEVGNFRFFYYKKHRTRLLATADKEIFSRLVPSNRTLLYAPTWQDDDQSGTFFTYGDRLLKELPSDWNLIIKVHPLLSERNPALFYRLSLLEDKRPNFLLLNQFPLIYPILEKIDLYLGDYSSIGYDALAFEKPMFFLQQPHLLPARLHSSGAILNPSQPLFYSMEKKLANAPLFKPFQTALYRRAFAPIEDVKETLESFLKTGEKM